jgi:galactose-1-phosphate uridylyltransferase
VRLENYPGRRNYATLGNFEQTSTARQVILTAHGARAVWSLRQQLLTNSVGKSVEKDCGFCNGARLQACRFFVQENIINLVLPLHLLPNHHGD